MDYCPYCNCDSVFYFKGGTPDIKYCHNCGLLYRVDALSGQKRLDLYRFRYFKEQGHDQTDRKRDNIYQHVLKQLSFRAPGSMLDVGTGCGLFLNAAQKMGWEAIGIDPSRDSIHYGRSRYGVEIIEGVLPEYKGPKRFDAITFINVLEHINEPWMDVRAAADLLNPGGTIYFRFPNANFHLMVYKTLNGLRLRNLASKLTILHKFLFTPDYMSRLLADSGFKNIKISSSPISTVRSYNADGSSDYIGIAIGKLFSLVLWLQIKILPNLRIGSALEATANR